MPFIGNALQVTSDDLERFALQYVNSYLRDEAEERRFIQGMSLAAFYLGLFTTPFEGQVCLADTKANIPEAFLSDTQGVRDTLVDALLALLRTPMETRP